LHKTRPLHQRYQRYQREFWPAMAVYVAIMFLLWPLLPRVHDEWLRVATGVADAVRGARDGAAGAG
jgi:hypothetical protein